MSDVYACCVCDQPAAVMDTEYHEPYCEEHARSYEVFDGPHRWLDVPAEAEPSTFPCAICGEPIVPGSAIPSEGEYAEFCDPAQPYDGFVNSYIAHAQCGIDRGYQLA